ncbi:MAG: hypothetical protein ABW038_02650, partial [Plantibacter flavus]
LLIAAFLGLVSAVFATHLLLASAAGTAVPVWAGAAISLYWLGIVGAATLGLDRIPRFRAVPALVMVIAAAVIALPLALAQPLGTSVVRESSGRQLPAYVTAATQTDPRLGTLVITPGDDGTITAVVIRGQGETLDGQSTIAQTAPGVSSDDRVVAELAGNLASQSGLDPTETLVEHGIAFVLLSPVADGEEQTVAGQTAGRAASALDANAALVAVGDTTSGTLWRTVADVGTGPELPTSNVLGTLIGVGLGVVFLITLLLSIPNGASRDGYRAGSRKPAKLKGRAARKAAASGATVAVIDDDATGTYDDEEPTADLDDEAEGSASADTADGSTRPSKPRWWRRGQASAGAPAPASAQAEATDDAVSVDDAPSTPDAASADDTVARDGTGVVVEDAVDSDPDVTGSTPAADAVVDSNTTADQVPDEPAIATGDAVVSEADPSDATETTPDTDTTRRDTPGTEQPHAQ